MKRVGRYDTVDKNDVSYCDNLSMSQLLKKKYINPAINNDNLDRTYFPLVCRSSILHILRIRNNGFIILPDWSTLIQYMMFAFI